MPQICYLCNLKSKKSTYSQSLLTLAALTFHATAAPERRRMSTETTRTSAGALADRTGRFLSRVNATWVGLPLWSAVLLLVLPLVAILWGYLLQDLSRHQSQLVRENEDRIYNVTQVSAQALKGLFIAVDQNLLQLREEWTSNPETFADRVEKRRAQTQAALGVDIHIAVIGKDGRVQFSSITPNAVGYNASQGRHFALPRDTATDRLFVSPPYFMPVAQQQFLPFSRRIPSADGKFNGVIVIWVPPDFVTQIYKTTRFEANSTFTLIELERGQVLLRHLKSPSTSLRPASGQAKDDRESHELKPAFPIKDEYMSALVLERAQQLPETGVGRWYSLIDQAERTFGWYKFNTVPFAWVAGEPVTKINESLSALRQRYGLTGVLLSLLLTASVSGTLALLRTSAKAAARKGRQLQAMADKQAELEESREKLRRLTQHLANVRESERKRIAQDLHDELGQRLSVARLSVAHIAQQLSSPTPKPSPATATATAQSPEIDAAAIQPAVMNLKAQIDDTIAVVRQIAEDMRPGALSVGLGPGIESLCDEFKQVLGMPCRCEIRLTPDTTLSGETATVAYRIVQESLTNVTRHAQATQFEIVVDAHNGWLLMSISDNGLGFKAGKNTHNTFGLLGMQERARAIGGEVGIHSVPGLGTHVKARLPLHPSSANNPAETDTPFPESP
jgi:signal transduction histidine kinase